jgi:hypothetical protein
MMKLSNTQVDALRLAAIGGDVFIQFRISTKDSLHCRDLLDGDYSITEKGKEKLLQLGQYPISYHVKVSYPMTHWTDIDVDKEFRDLIEVSFDGLAYAAGSCAGFGRRDLSYIVEKSRLQHFKAVARDFFKKERIPVRIASWKYNPEE